MSLFVQRFLPICVFASCMACATAALAVCSAGTWPDGCAFNGDNTHDWDFVAPVCSMADPKHFFITQTSDWDEINNPAYEVFCVQPGDYRDWNSGAVLNLTEKGTASNPRWIMLYDPDNPGDTSHPVHLSASRQAIMPHFRIVDGNYWHIYRMTVKGYSLNSGGVINTDGTRFSHMLIEEGEKSAFPWVTGQNGNYIFQYIVHRNIVPSPSSQDRVAFYVETCDFQPCAIVRNEIINPAADAIQVAGKTYHGGIRIDENEMYMTDARRTDCDTGLPDADGLCAANETMIVFKAPSTEPAEPSYITNNVIHHSYYYDGVSCCASGKKPAPAINIGSGFAGPLSNIVIENNIIFESSQGIHSANNGTNGAKDISVRRNLLYKIDSLSDKLEGDATALRNHTGYGIVERNNVIVDGMISLVTTNKYTKDHQCNVAIDAGNFAYYSTRGIWANNHAYGLSDIVPGTGYVNQGNSADSRHTDLCITIHWITNPSTYCIPYGKIAIDSPHFNCAPQ